MDRAEFLKRATAGAAGLALATAAPARKSATARAAKPNILLIMTDDQPYHTLGIMESVQRRLVAEGMSFTNGYVATPVCGPARGSVLTGKWSHNTGLETTDRRLARPGRFRRAGPQHSQAAQGRRVLLSPDGQVHQQPQERPVGMPRIRKLVGPARGPQQPEPHLFQQRGRRPHRHPPRRYPGGQRDHGGGDVHGEVHPQPP